MGEAFVMGRDVPRLTTRDLFAIRVQSPLNRTRHSVFYSSERIRAEESVENTWRLKRVVLGAKTGGHAYRPRDNL